MTVASPLESCTEGLLKDYEAVWLTLSQVYFSLQLRAACGSVKTRERPDLLKGVR